MTPTHRKIFFCSRLLLMILLSGLYLRFLFGPPESPHHCRHFWNSPYYKWSGFHHANFVSFFLSYYTICSRSLFMICKLRIFTHSLRGTRLYPSLAAIFVSCKRTRNSYEIPLWVVYYYTTCLFLVFVMICRFRFFLTFLNIQPEFTHRRWQFWIYIFTWIFHHAKQLRN